MGAHLVNGKFQSDKYPTCPPGKVPLSVEDPGAQDLLWEYAQRRRSIDPEFSDDLEQALSAAGYQHGTPVKSFCGCGATFRTAEDYRDHLNPSGTCDGMLATNSTTFVR